MKRNHSTQSPRTPLLTAADERRLAATIEAAEEARGRHEVGESQPGDLETVARGDSARQRFMEANLGLVYRVANTMRAPAHVDREDMVQDGMLGLERAVEKFDHTKGFKFSTYATWWIRQAIQRGLENSASTIRIPAYRSSELYGALAEVDGDVARLEPGLATVASAARVGSLDHRVSDADWTLGDSIASLDAEPGELVAEIEQRRAVVAMVDQLDPPARQAIIRRFGLDGREQAT
ncbi:MAG: sigma-70 family RNA polymerase sigma factor, partial [Acidimicrobiales bacterium]|nr:sigma-70 family RNA polymerase sigma factor [Acidimicrobiales bacterium]